MHAFRRALATGAVVILCSFILSGCFIRTMIGGVGTLPSDRLIVTFGTDSNFAFCVRQELEDSSGTVFDCQYWFIDRSDSEEGLVIEVVSTFELISEFGLFGVLIDPLILQVPENVSNYSGNLRRSAGDNPVPLVITQTDSFNVDSTTTVDAETGNTFLIVEIPDELIPELGLEEGDARIGPAFFLELEFELEGTPPVEVKPMASVRVDIGDDRYYVPTVPCVTDFANVPTIQIPEGTNVDLGPQMLDAFFEALRADNLVCDGNQYSFDPPDGNGDDSENGDDIDPPPSTDVIVIDVLPGSDPSPISPRSRGATPVAILTTSVADGDPVDFEAASVDLSSLRFGPDGAEAWRGSLEDIDGDGDLDLVVHFWTSETGITCGDTSVELTGNTIDNFAFTGTDDIRTVGCR